MFRKSYHFPINFCFILLSFVRSKIIVLQKTFYKNTYFLKIYKFIKRITSYLNLNLHIMSKMCESYVVLRKDRWKMFQNKEKSQVIPWFYITVYVGFDFAIINIETNERQLKHIPNKIRYIRDCTYVTMLKFGSLHLPHANPLVVTYFN